MELRKGLFLLFALVGSLVSHIVGGGSFISPLRFTVELATIAAVLLSLRGREYEGPALAMALLIVQATGHIIFGGASSNDARMLIAHLAGGTLSYLFITHFDRIWSDITSLIATLLPIVPKSFSLVLFGQPSFCIELSLPSFNFSHEDFSRRGPPCN